MENGVRGNDLSVSRLHPRLARCTVSGYLWRTAATGLGAVHARVGEPRKNRDWAEGPMPLPELLSPVSAIRRPGQVHQINQHRLNLVFRRVLANKLKVRGH